MNTVLSFNKGLTYCNYNKLKINDMRKSLSENIVCDGYFYLQWMFPLVGVSKWHTNISNLTKDDIYQISKDKQAIVNILESAKIVLFFFDLKIENNIFVCVDNFRCKSDFWLRGIGHEEKKISRIALSLYEIGFDELARSLISTSIETLRERGFKTKIDTYETINFWENLFNSKCLY